MKNKMKLGKMIIALIATSTFFYSPLHLNATENTGNEISVHQEDFNSEEELTEYVEDMFEQGVTEYVEDMFEQGVTGVTVLFDDDAINEGDTVKTDDEIIENLDNSEKNTRVILNIRTISTVVLAAKNTFNSNDDSLAYVYGAAGTTITLSQTVTKSNSYTANASIKAKDISAGIGFNVTESVSHTASNSFPIPKTITPMPKNKKLVGGSITAYPVYNKYTFKIIDFNTVTKTSKHIGYGTATKITGVRYSNSYDIK